MNGHEAKVAILLSGGLDSAMAALHLLRHGCQVQGVHLRLIEDQTGSRQATAMSRFLGIPLAVLDLRQAFHQQVIHYFVQGYSLGYTPNPCVQCNAIIKFGQAWDLLAGQGVTHLATGHYARVAKAADGSFQILRGLDKRKDQSYFLCRLPRQLLPHLILPLGELTKGAVKEEAHKLGVAALSRHQESQELCFIKEKRYADFLRSWPGWRSSPGEVLDREGRLLGWHRGLEYYTVGQRRGLGLPDREPYYVLDIQPETNRLVVGHRNELQAPGLLATRMNWLIEPPPFPLTAQAVIRYRHPGVQAYLEPLGTSGLRVIFATPQTGVAPGQAVAFYQGDLLLGGAWIEKRL